MTAQLLMPNCRTTKNMRRAGCASCQVWGAKISHDLPSFIFKVFTFSEFGVFSGFAETST
jgi:hypothetical protein